jgi:hypothetical protein
MPEASSQDQHDKMKNNHHCKCLILLLFRPKLGHVAQRFLLHIPIRKSTPLGNRGLQYGPGVALREDLQQKPLSYATKFRLKVKSNSITRIMMMISLDFMSENHQADGACTAVLLWLDDIHLCGIFASMPSCFQAK